MPHGTMRNRVLQCRTFLRACLAAVLTLLITPALSIAADYETQVLDQLAAMRAADTDRQYHNVPDDDGRILRLVVRLTGAQRVLEVGTSNGYSALWLGLGLKETGGELATIEIAEDRVRMARENIRTAGLEEIITVHHGDAADIIPTLDDGFDVIFIDLGDAALSRKFFDLAFPKLRKGGVILFHAVRFTHGNMGEFVEFLQAHPRLDTFIIPITRPGISLSYKTE